MQNVDKRNEFWETLGYFSQMKRYLRLSTNLHICELHNIMCIICIRSGTNIEIEANVRNIASLANKPFKNFTRSCLHGQNKCKHTFVNYTVCEV